MKVSQESVESGSCVEAEEVQNTEKEINGEIDENNDVSVTRDVNTCVFLVPKPICCIYFWLLGGRKVKYWPIMNSNISSFTK